MCIRDSRETVLGAGQQLEAVVEQHRAAILTLEAGARTEVNRLKEDLQRTQAAASGELARIQSELVHTQDAARQEFVEQRRDLAQRSDDLKASLLALAASAKEEFRKLEQAIGTIKGEMSASAAIVAPTFSSAAGTATATASASA
eukprot:9358223-Lingulodinium_polyedra.AAC.1